MKIKTILAMCVIALAFTNCKKAEKGEAGTAGTNGTNGNANVKSVMLTASSWTWDATNYWRTTAFYNVSILTSDVVNGGAVMLYQNDGAGNYGALPISLNITNSVQEHDYFAYGVNQLAIVIENSDLSDPNPPALTYKLVCIPKSARMANPNVGLTDYNKVKKEYQLKD